MHSSSKLFALVSCLAFALGGCAANPSVNGSVVHAGTSTMLYSASAPTHDVISEYKPAAMPRSLDGRGIATSSGPSARPRLEGVGNRGR